MATRMQPRGDPRVAKTLDRKLRDLQYHSHQVRQLLHEPRQSEEHIKALAAELRVLLCLSGKTEGLLWRLIDALHLDDTVYVHQPPSFDPAHPLASKRVLSFCRLHRADLWSGSPPVAKQSYRRIIKEFEAAFAAGVSLTHERLIRKVAEQTGTGHESDNVDVGLLDLSAVSLAGSGLLPQLLATDAWLSRTLRASA